MNKADSLKYGQNHEKPRTAGWDKTDKDYNQN